MKIKYFEPGKQFEEASTIRPAGLSFLTLTMLAFTGGMIWLFLNIWHLMDTSTMPKFFSWSMVSFYGFFAVCGLLILVACLGGVWLKIHPSTQVAKKAESIAPISSK